MGEGPVEIRAFRGTRRTSVYRDHVVPEAAFARMLVLAHERRLRTLAAIVPAHAHELDKRTARQLASDVESLRRSAALLDLDDDLTAIAEVARWCTRASGPAWLTVAYLS